MYFYTVSLPRDISSKETHVWRSSLSLYITASLTNYNASFSSSPLSVVWTTLRHYIHIFHPLHLFESHSTSQHSFRWHISLVGIYIYACCSTIRPTETDREHELSRAVLYTYIYMHAEQTKRKIGDTLGGREREKLYRDGNVHFPSMVANSRPYRGDIHTKFPPSTPCPTCFVTVEEVPCIRTE